jgi:hypothetical protein
MAMVQIVNIVSDLFVRTCQSSPPGGDMKNPIIVNKVPVMAPIYINFLFFVKREIKTREI